MASADELAALHRAANVPASDTTYPDDMLSELIDSLGVDGAAAQIWREKAAASAEMVDTTESGSSRKLSDLHKNALDMAAGFASVSTASSSRGRSFTVAVERQ